jgi:hypothetical protein
MRRPIASVLMIATMTTSAFASQARGGGSSSRMSACSLLTKEVVMKYATENGKRLLDLIKPMEDEIGAVGSGCEYGGIMLQTDPFGRAEELRKSPGKEWQGVSGVGDTAYFRNNRHDYAELMVWSGTHHFTIQMSVPMGSTAESIKPNTIGLANYLITKLR